MGHKEDIEKRIDAQDLTLPPPDVEPERQFYFIKKCREYVKKRSEELGRPLYACTVNMGCQVNTVHETRKPPILGGFLYGYINYRGTGRKGQDGAAGHADGAFYGVSS